MPTPKDKPEPKKKPKGKPPPKHRDMPALLPPDPFADDKKMRAEAQGRCIAFGAERVKDCILEGLPLTQIAQRIGVATSSLLRWISGDSVLAKEINDARITAARTWDERAEELVAYASDPFKLAKAKELAHHYRWRASCIAPREFNPTKVGDPDALATDQNTFLKELADHLPD
jgi:hypothetical protein